MSIPERTPVIVPTIEELKRCVIPRPASSPAPEAGEKPATDGPDMSGEAARPWLSNNAYKFLLHAARPGNETMSLGERYRAIGIKSDSTGNHLLDELRRFGLIRLENRKKEKVAILTNRGWAFLHVKPPKTSGRGSALHQKLADLMARTFTSKGYDTRIECELGPTRKRVDVVATGKNHTIGIEIALGDIVQEMKNLVSDFRTGVVDYVVVASPHESVLGRIKERASAEADLSSVLDRIRYYKIPEGAMPK